MRLTVSRLLTLVILIALVGNTAASECPPCDVSQPNLGGSGTASDSRILLQLYIDSSWNIDASGNSISGTNSNIWNAIVGYHDSNVSLNGATEMWNNASSGSNQIAYHFDVNQSFFSHSDVVIRRGTPEGGCAAVQYNASTDTWEMILSDGLKNLSHEWIAAIIAHELGHTLGLWEGQSSDCVATIMNGHYPGGCEPIIKTIQTIDVDSARKHKNDQLHCSVQSQPEVIINYTQGQVPTTSQDCYVAGGYWNYYQNTCSPTPPPCTEQLYSCLGGQYWDEFACGCFAWPPTPIVVDVLGNGFELTNAQGGVNFDISNRGRR